MQHVVPPTASKALVPEPELYTRKGFCAAHGICQTSFHAEVNAGRLVAVKFHGRTLVRREHAEAWRASLPRVIPKP